MKGEDFAAWLSAISGLNEGQRAEAIAALEKASAVGAEGGGSAKKAGQRSRQKDALGTTSRRARRGSGLSPLRGPRGRRLGPLARAFAVSLQELRAHLQCADQDADGASAQEGEMARSRPGDDRGQEPGQDRGARAASIRRRPSAGDIGFCAPRQVDKPRGLSGIVEADETFILESFKGRWSDLPRKAQKARRNGQACWPLSRQHSHPCRPRPERRHLRRDPASGRRRFGEPRPRRRRHAGQSSHRRWREGDRHFRPRRAGIPFHAAPAPGKPTPAAPHLHINNVNAYHGRLKQWLNRFNGVATKNLPNYSRLAARPRSLGRQTRTANLDQRRDRKRPIPTTVLIAAAGAAPLLALTQRRRRKRKWRRAQ